jgi:hypothetical protein
MKKIFAFIGIAAVSVAILSSCGKSNVPSVFDDSNAFVAFNIASANIDEDSADTLRIPVTLASVAGLNERISYTVVDGTAKDGVNFTIPDASKTLSFNAENRVQYIEVVPKADGLYTGDQTFTIKLNASDNVNLGAASTCSVKINDIDHPLTPILGTWTFTAMSAASNSQVVYTVTILKDDTDDHMVWFDNIFGLDGWKGDDMLYYGNVSDDLTQIVVPWGQESEYLYKGTTPISIYGFDSEGYYYTSGSSTAKITFGETTKISFGTEYGFYFKVGDYGGLTGLFPEITGVKN